MFRRQFLQLTAGFAIPSVLAASGIATEVAAQAAMKAPKQAPKLAMDEVMVASSDPGISIYVRNKRLANMTSFRPERTVLFVHGSTYPSHTAFDLQLGGMSWMDYIAARGYDVYLLDLRGYGKSTRPKEMSEEAKTNPPIVRGATAVKDIGTVVDFILMRRKISKLNLLGWSWGTTLMATYTTQNPSKVQRLILYAPQWIRTTPAGVQAGAGPLQAYRSVRKDQARDRWLNGVPEDKKTTLIPSGWLEQWADATWATDPVGAKLNPPMLRAPNGTVQDTAEFWAAGKAYYDPAMISVPTLIVGAEWDADNPAYMRQALFPLLKSSPDKRYVELSEGTHSIMMEKNRLRLFEAVQSFLDEENRS
jgi:pimeloyl-ACP methyl ester carboxylesterase